MVSMFGPWIITGLNYRQNMHEAFVYASDSLIAIQVIRLISCNITGTINYNLILTLAAFLIIKFDLIFYPMVIILIKFAFHSD